MKKSTQRHFNKYDLSGEYGIGYTTNTNKEFYFDLEDYNKIKNYCWWENDNGYVISQKYKKNIRLHRVIMNPPKNKQVDHIYHNRMDNRKINLRIVSNQENSCNKKVKGVYYDKTKKKWAACLTFNKDKHFKRFNNIDDAIKYREYLEDKFFKEYKFQCS